MTNSKLNQENNDDVNTIKQIQEQEQKANNLIDESNAKKLIALKQAKDKADEIIKKTMKIIKDSRTYQLAKINKELNLKKQKELKNVEEYLIKLKSMKLNSKQLIQISDQIIQQIIK